MPIATPEVYAEMLGRAKEHSFAFPAINCTSFGDRQRRDEGIRRRGQRRHHPVLHRRSGVRAPAWASRTWSPARWRWPSSRTSSPTSTRSPSPCTPTTARRTSSTPTCGRCWRSPQSGSPRARNPLFQSHMWDGSAVPIDENLAIAQELLKQAAAAKIILEIEIGVVGGEEDGVEAEINDKLYTTPEDFEKTIEALGAGEHGKYLLAATFGNVHGVYKPGNVKLRPEILAEGQKVAAAKLGLPEGCQAVRLRLPRRVGLAEVGDRGVAALRRGEDERRHRHPVRVHPPDRRRTCSPTTTACSRSTARSATRRSTTRAAT